MSRVSKMLKSFWNDVDNGKIVVGNEVLWLITALETEIHNTQLLTQIQPKEIENKFTTNIEVQSAFWEVWAGWAGNHDRRIDGAKCLSCGYEHPIVYDSLKNLSEICPSCHSHMKVKLVG